MISEIIPEIIPNSIVLFISAKYTEIPSVLNVLNLLGRTATLTPEVEIESCPDYSRAFPFGNDVPVLLLNTLMIFNEGSKLVKAVLSGAQ